IILRKITSRGLTSGLTAPAQVQSQRSNRFYYFFCDIHVGASKEDVSTIRGARHRGSNIGARVGTEHRLEISKD
ncbi:unnamed protein product, partial [Trichogramma brassicae]